jgi:hypothetical protein
MWAMERWPAVPHRNTIVGPFSKTSAPCLHRNHRLDVLQRPGSRQLAGVARGGSHAKAIQRHVGTAHPGSGRDPRALRSPWTVSATGQLRSRCHEHSSSDQKSRGRARQCHAGGRHGLGAISARTPSAKSTRAFDLVSLFGPGPTAFDRSDQDTDRQAGRTHQTSAHSAIDCRIRWLLPVPLQRSQERQQLRATQRIQQARRCCALVLPRRCIRRGGRGCVASRDAAVEARKRRATPGAVGISWSCAATGGSEPPARFLFRQRRLRDFDRAVLFELCQ